MKSMVYISLAAHPMTDDDLKAILEKARRNNEPRGVTGMLLYQEGMFIQSLEGEEEALHEIFDKIRHDDRHKNIITVYETEISERSFGNWTMGFNRLEDANSSELPEFRSFLEQPQPMFLSSSPSRAQKLLEHFKDRTFF